MPNPVYIIRSAAFCGFEELARQVGLDARDYLVECSLPAASLDDPELRIPAADAVRALEKFAERTGMSDVGLRLAGGQNIWVAGPALIPALIGARTLREVLQKTVAHIGLHSSGTVLDLVEGSRPVLCVDQLTGLSMPMRQTAEYQVCLLARVLRNLLGAHWVPLEVSFRHESPADVERYRRLFGCRVRFGAAANALRLRVADLAAPVRQPMGAPAVAPTFLARASVAVCALLARRRCTAPAVAAQLGIERSTLHRRLKADAMNFQTLVDQVRSEQLARQLPDAAIPLADIARNLGFASASAFAHWHLRCFGQSAGARRRTLARA